ncbi:EAL domain-containing protein [Aeromicrobium sp. Sec7.5]|uniref:EAL domain-containing protein n=1 Tax=Aeromicrobium sp. Sec7.5 TaxID=3121276 RepID=UPI002FE45AC1
MNVSPGFTDQALDLAVAGPSVGLRPVLDVARRTAAGFEVVPRADLDAGDATRAGLEARATLPPHTFLTVPVAPDDLADPAWPDLMTSSGDLGGVVVHLDRPERLGVEARRHLQAVRDAGALLSTGSRLEDQPSLSTIAELRPAILRLGRSWVRDLDVDRTKQGVLAAIGRLASQLDAWILADDVATGAELAALASLEVPLAQGPVVGVAAWPWPSVSREAHRALRRSADRGSPDLTLRHLVQRAFTVRGDTELEARPAEQAGQDLTVVLDDRGRPVSLLVRRAGRWAAERPFTIHVDTTPEQALERALHRVPGHDDAPLVCTDTAGRFCGILQQDRLVAHVATNRS